MLSSKNGQMSRGLDADRGIGDIVHRYLASRSIDGVLAHHRERVRKAVAAFFSTGHSLDTLVAQLVVNSANVRRFLRRMVGASARNMGIDLADLHKMA